jgi:serine/threonine protein kinase
MNEPSEPSIPDQLRSVIQTQHPGISVEIEGAINTLRKLQKIAGPSESAPPPQQHADDSSLIATTDSTNEIGSDSIAPRPEKAASKNSDTIGVESADGDQPVLAAGEAFGRYQITRLLGRGAMGAVYLAYDTQLQRYVALKTPSLEKNPLIVERFMREARAAAQLRSPFVCPVYDVGQFSGIYYLSMAFIDGQPLRQAINERRFKDSKAIAAVVAKIARGLQKAHESGIIHRDLKPDNIMIDLDGEPIVMDFGLARRVDDDIQLTTPGRLLGTPAYMSPEQVEGDSDKIGLATDIYSLGVILYQILTDRLPFKGSLTSVLRQIANEDPERPSAINAQLGADSLLEKVCLKLMAKSPADRYASMAELAQTLEDGFTRVEAPPAKRSLWHWLCSWFSKTPATPVNAPPAKVTATKAAALPVQSQLEETSAEVSTPAAPEPPRPAAPAAGKLEETSADLSLLPQPRKDISQTVDLPDADIS